MSQLVRRKPSFFAISAVIFTTICRKIEASYVVFATSSDELDFDDDYYKDRIKTPRRNSSIPTDARAKAQDELLPKEKRLADGTTEIVSPYNRDLDALFKAEMHEDGEEFVQTNCCGCEACFYDVPRTESDLPYSGRQSALRINEWSDPNDDDGIPGLESLADDEDGCKTLEAVIVQIPPKGLSTIGNRNAEVGQFNSTSNSNYSGNNSSDEIRGTNNAEINDNNGHIGAETYGANDDTARIQTQTELHQFNVRWDVAGGLVSGKVSQPYIYDSNVFKALKEHELQMVPREGEEDEFVKPIIKKPASNFSHAPCAMSKAQQVGFSTVGAGLAGAAAHYAAQTYFPPAGLIGSLTQTPMMANLTNPATQAFLTANAGSLGAFLGYKAGKMKDDVRIISVKMGNSRLFDSTDFAISDANTPIGMQFFLGSNTVVPKKEKSLRQIIAENQAAQEAEENGEGSDGGSDNDDGGDKKSQKKRKKRSKKSKDRDSDDIVSADKGKCTKSTNSKSGTQLALQKSEFIGALADTAKTKVKGWFGYGTEDPNGPNGENDPTADLNDPSKPPKDPSKVVLIERGSEGITVGLTLNKSPLRTFKQIPYIASGRLDFEKTRIPSNSLIVANVEVPVIDMRKGQNSYDQLSEHIRTRILLKLAKEKGKHNNKQHNDKNSSTEKVINEIMNEIEMANISTKLCEASESEKEKLREAFDKKRTEELAERKKKEDEEACECNGPCDFINCDSVPEEELEVTNAEGEVVAKATVESDGDVTVETKNTDGAVTVGNVNDLPEKKPETPPAAAAAAVSDKKDDFEELDPIDDPNYDAGAVYKIEVTFEGKFTARKFDTSTGSYDDTHINELSFGKTKLIFFVPIVDVDGVYKIHHSTKREKSYRKLKKEPTFSWTQELTVGLYWTDYFVRWYVGEDSKNLKMVQAARAVDRPDGTPFFKRNILAQLKKRLRRGGLDLGDDPEQTESEISQTLEEKQQNIKKISRASYGFLGYDRYLSFDTTVVKPQTERATSSFLSSLARYLSINPKLPAYVGKPAKKVAEIAAEAKAKLDEEEWHPLYNQGLSKSKIKSSLKNLTIYKPSIGGSELLSDWVTRNDDQECCCDTIHNFACGTFPTICAQFCCVEPCQKFVVCYDHTKDECCCGACRGCTQEVCAETCCCCDEGDCCGEDPPPPAPSMGGMKPRDIVGKHTGKTYTMNHQLFCTDADVHEWDRQKLYMDMLLEHTGSASINISSLSLNRTKAKQVWLDHPNAIKFSDKCMRCVIDMIDSTIDNCKWQCMSDSNSPKCRNCVRDATQRDRSKYPEPFTQAYSLTGKRRFTLEFCTGFLSREEIESYDGIWK